MNPPRLEMVGVTKRFGATTALENVSFAVNSSTVHALVGENGAGKSTLMKILAGAISPDAGEMRLDGKDYSPRHPLDARRAGVAMIYQELSLCPHLSVEENILLGMEPRALGLLNRREMRLRAAEALRQLSHADIRPRTLASQLSLAQQQLVEIARAVAIRCRVLVLDEPTSSLGVEDAARLFALIDTLKSQGHAIVYISHFLEEVKEIADEFTVLRDGRSVGGGKTSGASIDQIITMMVGREVSDLYTRSQRTPGEVILKLGDVAGARKPVRASLELRRGEVLGIAGLLGAGRTELLRTIFGLDTLRSGRLQLAVHVGPRSPRARWREAAGMLSEDRKNEGLAASLSVADNLTLSKPQARLGIISPRRQHLIARTWLEKLNIRARSPRQKTFELSGGNQQKVAIARLLHHNVDVLLLDEPTRGIDVASKAEIYKLIDQLAASGKAILMVSSYLPELLGICDRIAVMSRGVLGEARPVANLDAQQIMFEATTS